MSNRLSVALATFNEEENIERCLASVKKIADEIVVVDGSSTDKTRELAKKAGAKVIKTTNKPIFHINKQMAVDKCTGDWILTLDADEEVSEELGKEILEIIEMNEDEIRKRRSELRAKSLEVENPPSLKLWRAQWKLFDRHQALLEERDGNFNQKADETVAFFMPRVNMFLGHPMRHTGVYPDGVIRLIKKDKARYPAKSVHEQIQVHGRVDWLTNDLLHYDSPTFEKYMKRSNRYTSLTAQELFDAKVSISLKNTLYYMIIKPKLTFLTLFIRHKGFLDGFAGFVFSLMSGLHWATAYLKLWELYEAKSSKVTK